MSAFLGLLYVLLTAAAGAATAGHVRARLTFFERALIAAVSGIVLSCALTYGLALAMGLNVFTVLAAPAVWCFVGVAASRWVGDPRTTWLDAWTEARVRWL